jgi:hypothetical protein
MTQYAISLEAVVNTAMAEAATKLTASLRWVDLSIHIYELLSYVLGYKRYKEIKYGALYNDLIVVCPKTDIVVDAIIGVIRAIDTRVTNTTNEKTHYSVMTIHVLDKKSLLLEVNVSD